MRTMRTLASKSKSAPGRATPCASSGADGAAGACGFPTRLDFGRRPTGVRETLFNWLQQSIAGTRCLDLFAGSGALGIEALSRGAREVVFVEQAREPARALSTELERLGGSAQAHVIETAAQRLSGRPGDPFDRIFLDPPYGRGYLPECVAAIGSGGLGQSRRLGLSRERTRGRLPRRTAKLVPREIEVGGRGGVSSGAHPRGANPRSGWTINKRTAMYPGTFDPITNGHNDLVRQRGNVFDRLVVAKRRQSQQSTDVLGARAAGRYGAQRAQRRPQCGCPRFRGAHGGLCPSKRPDGDRARFGRGIGLRVPSFNC